MSLDRLPHFWRRVGEPALTIGSRRNPAPHELAEWVDLDRPLRESDAIADVSDTSLQTQLGAGLRVDVRASGEFVLPVPRHDADVVVVGAREIVPVGIRTAA